MVSRTSAKKMDLAFPVRLIIIILVISNVFCIVKISSLQNQINESGLTKAQVNKMITKSMTVFNTEYAGVLANTLENFTDQIDKRFDTVNANLDVLVKNVNDFNETVSNLRSALQ
jgi:chaperonin cofactor prefoldin